MIEDGIELIENPSTTNYKQYEKFYEEVSRYMNNNDIINGSINDNDISFGFELGLTYRWLAGDIVNTMNKELRYNILSTYAKRFIGLEAGMQIKFGSITAGIQGYWLTTNLFRTSDSVPGVTKGQISAGFSISGPIFQGFID